MKNLFPAISLLLILVTPLRGLDDVTHRYNLPGHGGIAMKAPAAWKEQIAQPPGALPPTIGFSPAAGSQFLIKITPIWQVKADKPLAEGPAIREQIRQMAAQYQADAVNKIEVQELKGSIGVGYYLFAVDRAPKPGEYKYMTQGMLRVGDLLLTFTILTNDGQQDVIKAALEMLKGTTRIVS